MGWSFATINNRSGEVYFNHNKIDGHCYVKRNHFTIKAELRAFDKETKNLIVIYRNKKYKLVRTGCV